MKYRLVVIFFIILSKSFPQTLVVNNTIPRVTQEDKIVDAHDGRLIQFGDTFYWYGTSYGNNNGFTEKNFYSVYSSTDLKTWKNEGQLLPDAPSGVYYRPHVIYNKKNDNYVLWYNWYPKLWEGQFGVAVSDNPIGPFKIIDEDVKMSNNHFGLGDFGLFVDDDQKAYISYNTIQDHQVSIEELNEDYTASTLKNGGFIAKHMEAGSQFKFRDKYYLLTDYTCCFCNQGSGARVYISDNPLMGYTYTGNINRYPGRLSLLLNDGNKLGTSYETLTKRDTVFESLELHFSENIPQFFNIHFFTGNREGNCGDVSNPRVHPIYEKPEIEISYWDFDHWEKIDFRTTSEKRAALSISVGVELPAIKASKLKITPKSNYVFEEIYITEIVSDNAVFKAFVTSKNISQPPIIPAQQNYIMQLNTKEGVKYIWMGDMWGSASDNIKGHDYQFWSKPLKFNADGTIKQLEWTDKWTVKMD